MGTGAHDVRASYPVSGRRTLRGFLSTRRSRARLCLILLGVMIAVLWIPASRGQQPKISEYQVKATYLYNFGRFVHWPPNAAAAQGDTFPVCVIGQDPFGPVLDSILAGESIDGKPLVARRIVKMQDAVNCRVLYISPTENGRLKDVLATLDKSGVLTVSDIPEFSRRGGMIQFVMVGNKIRFEVNLTSTQDAGLPLSSDLLKVAVAVRTTSLPGD